MKLDKFEKNVRHSSMNTLLNRMKSHEAENKWIRHRKVKNFILLRVKVQIESLRDPNWTHENFLISRKKEKKRKSLPKPERVFLVVMDNLKRVFLFYENKVDRFNFWSNFVCCFYPVGFKPWRRTAEYRIAMVTALARRIEKKAQRFTRVANIAP